MGLTVKRVTVVGDNLPDISAAINEAIQRQPLFILTTGGLGPTFDDMTLEGLAQALGRKTVVDEQALRMVADKYRLYAKDVELDEIKLTSHRVKMAKIPQGSKPVFNPVGTAPAVRVELGTVTVFALPGVPSEMKRIFDESIAPLLKKVGCGVVFFEASISSVDVMESEIAPSVDVVMKDNPYVYVKSHPKGAETTPFIEFHVSTTAKDRSTAKERVDKAIAQLVELVAAKGGRFTNSVG